MQRNLEDSNNKDNENYKILSQEEIEKCSKSLNPEEELSNLFKNIIFKSNSNTVYYPKVSLLNLKLMYCYIVYI